MESEPLIPPSRNPTPSGAAGYGSTSSNDTPERRRRRPAIIEADRCWSVPLAAAVVAFLCYLPSWSYAYLYVIFMDVYGVQREQAAWPQTMLAICGGCSGILVSLLQKRFSVYNITLTGAAIAATGVAASSFATNIFWLTATFGVIQGAGVGTTLLGVAIYLMLYFDKRKATVTAIKEVGTVVALATAVPLASSLTTIFGLHGCLLLFGGFMMNMMPVVMLIKSPRPFKACGAKGRKLPNKGATEDRKQAPNPSSPEAEAQTASSPHTGLPTSSNSLTVLLSAFVAPTFYVLVILQVISDFVSVTYTITIVDYVVDKGTELAWAKMIPTWGSAGQIFGRVILPVLMDRVPFSRSPVATACFYAAAVSYMSIPLASVFTHVAFLACMVGVAEGYVVCIKPLLIADYIGLEWYSFCCGVAGFGGVPLWLCQPIILGFFRDARGSYDNLYFMLAGLNLVVAVLLTLLTCCDVMKRRRQA